MKVNTNYANFVDTERMCYTMGIFAALLINWAQCLIGRIFKFILDRKLLLALPIAVSIILLINRLYTGFLVLILMTTCLFGIWKACELFDPYKTKAKRYIRYLKCINLGYSFSFSSHKSINCRRLLEILNRLTIDSDKSIGIEFPDEDNLGDTSKLYIFSKAKAEDRLYDLSNHITVENSELGAWHFYLLMGSEYYLPLWDHANYMAKRFITSKRQMIVVKHKYSGSDDLQPHITFTKMSESSSEALVSACYWSDWGGLIRETYLLTINDNHVTKFEEINSDCLLEYMCGIMF